MTAKEVMLVSQRESTMLSTYKYRQHDEVGRQKHQGRGSPTEEAMVEKNLHIKSLGRKLVDGQTITQMITGD